MLGWTIARPVAILCFIALSVDARSLLQGMPSVCTDTLCKAFGRGLVCASPMGPLMSDYCMYKRRVL